MAIDMTTLFAATHGDQEAKVNIKRSWLTEVHRLLLRGQKAERELAELKAEIAAKRDIGSDKRWKDFEKNYDHNHGIDEAFSDSGLFGKFFGKGRF
jgi:hypothetical protein